MVLGQVPLLGGVGVGSFMERHARIISAALPPVRSAPP